MQSCQDTSFVVACVTGGCRYDNRRYQEWRQISHLDNCRVSVIQNCYNLHKIQPAATFPSYVSWNRQIFRHSQRVTVTYNAPQKTGIARYGLSQWETTLQCNVVSHRLSLYSEWSLENKANSLQKVFDEWFHLKYDSSFLCTKWDLFGYIDLFFLLLSSSKMLLFILASWHLIR